MTGRLQVKENDRMCAAQRLVSVDPYIGLIAIFKNKANNRKNGTNLSSQKEKPSEKHVGLRSEEYPESSL